MYDQISNLDEYIEIANRLSDSGCFTFRGQCCSSWLLEPGIIRRIKETYTGIGQSGLLFSLALDSTVDLVKSARSNEHFKQKECDLNILAILQHYGAASPLLDFTHSPLVALYFACQPYEKEGAASDGKVFSINYPDQIRSYKSPMRPVSDPTEISIESDLFPNEHPGIWYWNTPDNLPCARNKRQQSVFVFGWGLYWKYNTDRLIDDLRLIIIPSESKSSMLEELESKYDISEQTLFSDSNCHGLCIYGFAQSNSHDKIIQHFSAEEFYEKGEEQWLDGGYEWAAEYYRMAYTKRPEYTDARCKCALALNENGEQSEALEVVEDSIKALGDKWEFFVCKAIVNEVLGNSWKADHGKAKVIADNENNSCTFKQFICEYGSRLSGQD